MNNCSLNKINYEICNASLLEALIDLHAECSHVRAHFATQRTLSFNLEKKNQRNFLQRLQGSG